MKWVGSDGSQVEVDGGAVKGRSRLADLVRGSFASHKLAPRKVTIGSEPHDRVRLDVRSVEHVDALVRELAASLGIDIVSAPEIEPAEISPRPELPDGAQY